MPSVFGNITAEDGNLPSPIKFIAYDKDFRSEQLLGEMVSTGVTYQILYTVEQFQRVEKKSADLIVRAFDENGIQLAESDIHFNAGENVQIDLIIKAKTVKPPSNLSELELLQQFIELIRENVEYHLFTDKDIIFLAEETFRQGIFARANRTIAQQHLELLRLAAQFEQDTSIVLAAFYGWFRMDQPRVLVDLLDVPTRTLHEALLSAISQNIIPDITPQIDEILEHIRSLRFERGRIINHRFVVQLINEETEQPLSGYAIEITDATAEPEDQNLGTLFTDSRGIFIVTFTLPADAPEDTVQEMSVAISDDEEQVLDEAVIQAVINQAETFILRVQLPEDESGNVPIVDFAPSELTERLRLLGATQLRDVLNPEIEDEEDAEGLENLRAIARRTLLPLDDLDENAQVALLDNGLDPFKIAEFSRTDFVERFHEALGDGGAAATYFAGRDTQKMVEHMAGSAMLELYTGPNDEVDDLPPGVKEQLEKRRRCGCKDCESAVSPTAYLAHLLSWVNRHVKNVQGSVTPVDLTRELHQPFGELPASCAAVEQKLRQVRVCIEVLWSYTGAADQLGGNIGGGVIIAPADPTPFVRQYHAFLNAFYRRILANLGSSFEQLRLAQLSEENGVLIQETLEEESNDPKRLVVANLLGIDVLHLNDLFLDIYRDPTEVSEENLQRLFGYRNTRAEDQFEALDEPVLIQWQQNRLEGLWQRQDWPTDDYSDDQRILPIIDPGVIDTSYLRTDMTNPNPALAILEARQEALAEREQQFAQIVENNPDENILPELIELQFDQATDIGQLRELHQTLQNDDDAEELSGTQQTIADLNLTQAGFSFVMDVDSRILNQQPLGENPEEIAEFWQSVIDIFVGVHRRSLFSDWIEEENQAGAIFGPKLFWLPTEATAPTNPWIALTSDRLAWEAALNQRSQRPIIDPHQFPAELIRIFRLVAHQRRFGTPQILLPPMNAYSFWETRRNWANDRLNIFIQARDDGQTAVENIAAILGSSTLGAGIELFSELAVLEESGIVIEPRLNQLSLTIREYRFLAEMNAVAENNQTIANNEWQQIGAIILMAEKRREYAEWQKQEQAGNIILHPSRFRLPRNPIKADDSAEDRWLFDALAQHRWESKLKAREDQLKALVQALENGVDDAEEATLTQLRDALILVSDANGKFLEDKADTLDKVLLIDMKMDACHLTTRVSQAIETIQRLVRGVYTHEHPEALQHIVFDDIEAYDTDWSVIGSYATRRAYMLAYLYPENLLHLTPTPWQSFGLSKLKKNLNISINPKLACELAKDYSNYFRDICSLEVQATCQIETLIETGDPCASISSLGKSRLHLFAVAPESNRVYWAHLDPTAENEETITTWVPLEKLGEVNRIEGATVHQTPQGHRYILIFASSAVQGRRELLLQKYDVEASHWHSVRGLALPSGFESGFSASIMQKRQSSSGNQYIDFNMPTQVVVTLNDGVSFIRKLRDDLNGWNRKNWFPLYGPAAVQEINGIRALVALNLFQYCIFADTTSGIKYRMVFENDDNIHQSDYSWRSLERRGGGTFRGAFVQPNVPAIFVFSHSSGKTHYKRFDFSSSPALRFQEFIFEDISNFNDNWLIPNIGISLDDTELFEFDRYVPEFFIPKELDQPQFSPHPLAEDENIQLANGDWTGNPYYSGSLLGLLTLGLNDFVFYAPDDAEYKTSGSEGTIRVNKFFYLYQLKHYGLQNFLDRIKGLDNVDYTHPKLGWWKYINDRIIELTENNLTLHEVLEQLLINQIHNDKKNNNLNPRWGNPKGQAASITLGSYDPVQPGPLTLISSNDWWIPSSSGEERTQNLEHAKVIVIQMQNGPFRTTAKFNDQGLTSRLTYPLAPFGNCFYDLIPINETSALEQRRDLIAAYYHPLRNTSYAIKSYLREAYFLVPILLGNVLQRGGNFEHALKFYQLVFDYTRSTGHYKIDYGLVLEQKLNYNFDDSLEWLKDKNNPHTIAITRKNTQTRHIILVIIRCLIEFSERLFSYDTATSNAHAKELLQQALKLLDFKVLSSGKSKCKNILGDLEIEVTESLDVFQVALSYISDPDQFSSLIVSLEQIQTDPNNDNSTLRLSRMRERVDATIRELPRPTSLSTVKEETSKNLVELANNYIIHQPNQALLKFSQKERFRSRINALASVTGRNKGETQREDLPWLRDRNAEETEVLQPTLATIHPELPPMNRFTVLNEIKFSQPLRTLTAFQRNDFSVTDGLSFSFCIPQNPLIKDLRTRVENNLVKLRQCRNIAGFVRELDPYGAPIGIGSGLVSPDGRNFDGIVQAPPTIYTYLYLIERSKQLVNIAQQIEAEYQTTLEKAENETLKVFEAEQRIQLSGTRLKLQDLRITQANNELELAQVQKQSALLRETTYSSWIKAGVNAHEFNMLNAFSDSSIANKNAVLARAAASVAQQQAQATGAWSLSKAPDFLTGVAATQTAFITASQIATLAEATFQEQSISAQAKAQNASFEANFERQNDQWQLQQGLATLDLQIGDQQIQLAQNGIAITQQERAIAELEQTHANDTLNFLLSKTFTEEMYHWIASVLEDVYRFFLQAATSTARLAEQQSAFERQEGEVNLIQSDYWTSPADNSPAGSNEVTIDRLGLTGSTRLLQSIYQLDQYVVETRQRKLQLTRTLDLAQLFPFEFQVFRETGELIFETSLEMIHRQFPGYYLCLIQQVSVSVVALLPTIDSLSGNLSGAGTSQTVVRSRTGSFETVTIRKFPERMALTSATTTSGIIDLVPDAQSLQALFSNTGFATRWQLQIPKAANSFNYNSMATVLFTVDMTALHSYDYERQVIESLDRTVGLDRAFDFRQVFADPWYDLNNPDQTDTPMVVRFETRRSDFPSNLTNLTIQHIVLYVVRKDGETFEQEIRHLHFTPEGANGYIGGPSTSVDGRVSTRSGNGTNWLPMIGLPPIGAWELAFPHDSPSDTQARDRFANEQIENLLLVISFNGQLPNWPS